MATKLQDIEQITRFKWRSVMSKTGRLALLTILVFSVANTAAFAIPVNWDLNAVFADGATATGSFVYDADTATYSDQDIQTTAGTLPAFHYTTSNSFVGLNSPVMVDFVEIGPPITQYIRLWFSAPLTNAGGVVALDLGQSYECSNCATLRRFTSGSVTGHEVVPEPVSIALLGIGLASVMALRKRLF